MKSDNIDIDQLAAKLQALAGHLSAIADLVTGDKAMTIMDQPVVEELEILDFDDAAETCLTALALISSAPSEQPAQPVADPNAVRPDIKWKRVSEARYNEMLEILPPAAWQSPGFLVGEPWDHAPCTINASALSAARFAPFLQYNDEMFEGDAPMTIREFRALKHADLERIAREAGPAA